MSVDTLVALTWAPYNYSNDNSLNYTDNIGLAGEAIGEGFSCPNPICFPFPRREEAQHAGEALEGIGKEIGHGIASVFSSVFDGESTDTTTQADEPQPDCGNDNPGRNPAQDKKLTSREIEALEDAGYHPHDLKPGGAREDLYHDRDGNIYTKPKGGQGPGEPTGLNTKELG